MAQTVNGTLTQDPDGRWTARTEGVTVRGTREEALERLEAAVRDRAGEETTVVVEVRPRLVGVAEAAEICRWDKRHVITYLNRGRFPEPLASLASGRVWALDDVAAFAATRRRRTER